MGTNYYLISKSRELMLENFAIAENEFVYEKESELVELPYLAYRVHLNKLSFGWRPLFQRHKSVQSFDKLRNFYLTNNDSLEIYDEYNKKWTWDEYYKRVLQHGNYDPEPYKWVYEEDELFKACSPGPSLHTVRCTEEEAELFTPFNHCIYAETEERARDKFHIYRAFNLEIHYWNDPDYPFDWTDQEFS